MSGKQISLIYFYIVSIISLILLVIGIYNTATFVINITQYEKYPLRYQETDCDLNPIQFGPTPFKPAGSDNPATVSAQELETQKQSCKKQQELLRKQQQLDDLKSSLVFSGVGLVLFLIHFTQARKHSNS